MKKSIVIPIALFVFICILAALLLAVVSYRGLGFSEGIYLRTDKGSNMIIMGNDPIVMSNRTNRDIFKNIDSGDRILILHDGIQESYPGGTGVYALFKRAEGKPEDIPEDVILSLAEMGWVSYPPSAAPKYEHHMSYANWSEDSIIFEEAINKDKFYISSVMHLPVYRIDSAEGLEKFRDDFDEHLSFDYGYDEVPSFNDLSAGYDESFFEEKSLLITYISTGSGSLRFDLADVATAGDELAILVKQVNNPEICTEDMAGWFLTVEFNKSDIERYNSITAYFEVK